MESFSPKIIPIAIEPDKGPISGSVFASEIKSKVEFKLGTVFALMEFLELPEDFVRGLTEIVDDLKTEYYLPPLEAELGVEKRLEECLQRANRRISKLIENCVEDIELGNINILIGLFHRERIYLSEIGKINSFLFHLSKNNHYSIINIFEQATNKRRQRAEMEKMFSNIISGEISERDNLFFCNDNVLAYLSQNEILETTAEISPEEGVKKIEDILLEQDDDSSFYFISIKADTKDNIFGSHKNIPPTEIIREKRVLVDTPQESLQKLVGTQKKTERYLAPSLMPNWQKFFILFFIGLKKIIKQAFKLMAKGVVVSWHFVKKTLKSRPKKLSPTSIVEIKNDTPENQIPAETVAINMEIKTEKSIEESTKENQEEKEPAKHLWPVKNQNNSLAERISHWLNQKIAAFVSLNTWQKTILISAVILILVFSQSVVMMGQKAFQNNNNDFQVKISAIRELINSAEAKNIFNDEENAKKYLAEAEKLLSELTTTKNTESAKQELLTQAEKLNQILQKVTVLNSLNIVADFKNNNAGFSGAGLTGFGQSLFVFDNNNHNLYQINITSKQITTWPLNSEIKNIKQIYAIDEKTVLLLNENKEFYRYNLSTKVIDKVLTEKNAIDDFGFYGGKIYALAAAENQIYKHSAVSTGFDQGVKWIKGSADLTDTKIMAIDGGIFTLKNNGELSYFLKGQFNKKQVISIVPAISSPTQITAGVDSNYLYIIEPANKRLIILNKNGELQAQYVNDELSGLKSIFLAEKEKIIYLLTNNKVIKIKLD